MDKISVFINFQQYFSCVFRQDSADPQIIMLKLDIWNALGHMGELGLDLFGLHSSQNYIQCLLYKNHFEHNNGKRSFLFCWPLAITSDTADYTITVINQFILLYC